MQYEINDDGEGVGIDVFVGFKEETIKKTAQSREDEPDARKIAYVKFTVSMGDTHITVDLTPKLAHDIGRGLLLDSWEATKWNMGSTNDTYRRLGFYH